MRLLFISRQFSVLSLNDLHPALSSLWPRTCRLRVTMTGAVHKNPAFMDPTRSYPGQAEDCPFASRGFPASWLHPLSLLRVSKELVSSCLHSSSEQPLLHSLTHERRTQALSTQQGLHSSFRICVTTSPGRGPLHCHLLNSDLGCAGDAVNILL